MSYSIYGHELVYGSEKFEITTYEDGGYIRNNARKDSGTDKDGNALTQFTFSCPERKKSDDDKIEYSKRIYFINDKEVGFDLREYDPTSHSFEQVNVNSDGFIKGTVTFKSSNAIQTENPVYLQYSEERNENGEIVKIVNNLPTDYNEDVGLVTTYFNSENEICRQLMSSQNGDYAFDTVISKENNSFSMKQTNYYDEEINDDLSEEKRYIHYSIEEDYFCSHDKKIFTISRYNLNIEAERSIDKRIEYDLKSDKITVLTYHGKEKPSITEYNSLEEYGLTAEYYDKLYGSRTFTNRIDNIYFEAIFKIIDENHIDVIRPCFSPDGSFSMQVEEKYETRFTDSTVIHTHSMLNDNGDFDETTTIDYLGEMSENGISLVLKTETYKNGNLTACEDYENFTYESYEHDDK